MRVELTLSHSRNAWRLIAVSIYFCNRTPLSQLCVPLDPALALLLGDFLKTLEDRLRRDSKSVPALMMAVILIASGCATQHTIVDKFDSTSLPTDRAFGSLGPGTPAPLSIVETYYANATRQEIVLATRGKTPGENRLQIDVFGLRNYGVALETTLPDVSLKEGELISEAEAALPDIPLRISSSYLQNRRGPFGYAVGKTKEGDTCIYAWQRLATPDRKLSVVNSRVALSIRLRLCDPQASEAALAAAMMNLSLNITLSGGSWTLEPKPLSADIGVAGVPIAPASIMASAVNPLPASTSPAPARRRRKHTNMGRLPELIPVAPDAQSPRDSSGLIVPPPPASLPSSPSAGESIVVPSPPVDARPPPKETRP